MHPLSCGRVVKGKTEFNNGEPMLENSPVRLFPPPLHNFLVILGEWNRFEPLHNFLVFLGELSHAVM